MNHPLNILGTRKGIVLSVLFIITLAMMVIMNMVGAPLINETAPLGIISYEFAGDVPTAQAIIDSWDTNARMSASLSLGLDYLFLVVYSTTIALGCLWSGELLKRMNWPLGGLATILAWLLWLAALMDAVENYALIRMLFGSVVSPLPAVAVICAGIKFGLIFAGLVYFMYGLVSWITTRLAR